jgi:valyl-tRNA synthetase
MNSENSLLSKTYNPQKTEQDIYQLWEESGKFNPDNLDLPEDAKTYTIILPPPNITDKLHLGHSSMLAIEDLLIRYHRMKGFRTLWVPGTDHAAIATQNVVEKKLLKEKGLSRHDLGREKFMEEAWVFMKNTQSTILNQIRRMGASLDWSRLAFTLDEPRKKAVEKMFIDMYEAGAIYRGERIVNWCPRCQSTLADDEVEHTTEKSVLYTFKYDEDFPIAISTTRPETKLGDTAVAINPEDKRYKDFLGKTFKANFCGIELKIKIIADPEVDMNFGTGALGVTPAHSMIDWQMAQKNNLKSIQVIDEKANIKEGFGDFSGKTALEARQEIVDKLREKTLMIEETEIENNLSVCYRCDTLIEPIPSEQWFVSVDKKLDKLDGKSLKKVAIEVAKKKEIEFIPERFNKRYQHWMENLHDWCISRQIWLGHRIPAWHKDGEIKVQTETPGDGWTQDPDTLDTWFSSGMWTFSTLGWPTSTKATAGDALKKTGDLAKFHPTQVLNTGYDILTLWVSRMIMMSLFAIKETPFEKVHLHGMVVDQNGKKMSKSKGNGINPLDMIEKYGTDAVRLSLLIGSTAGNDIRISERKIEGYRNFVNKFWNISRFILEQLKNKKLKSEDQLENLDKKDLTLADKWILAEINELQIEVEKDLRKHDFSGAGEKIRKLTRNNLADWYLEISKIEKNDSKQIILSEILKDLLKLWHPFIPFITETIWQKINPSMLMIEKFPATNKYAKYSEKNSSFQLIQKIVTAIRNARAQYQLNPSNKISVYIYAGKQVAEIKKQANLIENLGTFIEKIEITEKGEEIPKSFYEQVEKVKIYIPLENLIDTKKELERLEKELERLENFLKIIEKKLSNEKFFKNAPKEIIEKEQIKKNETEIKIKLIQNQIERIK